MKVGRDGEGLVALDESREAWVRIPGQDLIALLGDAQALADAEADLAQGEPAGPPSGLPFVPRSFRDFSIYESHMINSARGLAQRFFPKPVKPITQAFERVTGRDFPKFKPPPKFYERPLFYMGNHTTFFGDGEEVPWPAYTEFLDFELELGVVIKRRIQDASPAQGLAAIGGLVVINDWSARDVQAEEYRRGVFGPVVKTKSFANSMGASILTDGLADWADRRAAVRVNGETWAESSTAGAQHDLGDMVAYASEGEPLDAGDLLATGTLPGCCGLELDRWVRKGDLVELDIEGVGVLRNRVASA